MKSKTKKHYKFKSKTKKNKKKPKKTRRYYYKYKKTFRKGGTRKYIFYPHNNEDMDEEWFFAWLLNKLLSRESFTSKDKRLIKKHCNIQFESEDQRNRCYNGLLNTTFDNDDIKKIRIYRKKYSDNENIILINFLNFWYKNKKATPPSYIFDMLHKPKSDMLEEFEHFSNQLKTDNYKNTYSDEQLKIILMHIEEIQQMLDDNNLNKNLPSLFPLEKQFNIQNYINYFYRNESEEKRKELFIEFLHSTKKALKATSNNKMNSEKQKISEMRILNPEAYEFATYGDLKKK